MEPSTEACLLAGFFLLIFFSETGNFHCKLPRFGVYLVAPLLQFNPCTAIANGVIYGWGSKKGEITDEKFIPPANSRQHNCFNNIISCLL
jgi:hypothetical protein|tara:strand:- start:64 stop:333 length:270 start_codon:yes stop_codon:yes gene_type:complete